MTFNEITFIKAILNESTNNNYSNIFDKHFNNLVKTENIEEIFNLYLEEIDIEDIKCRYGKNYIEIKLDLILYTKLLNYMVKTKDNN